MIRAGKRVKVTQGVWAGLVGTVVRSAGDARLWLVHLDINERASIWESALQEVQQ